MEQDHVKSTVARQPRVFAVVTVIVKSLWQRMKYETEDLDNLVEGLKTWESLKGPKKEGMKVEFTAHANDVRFHFT